MAHKKYKYFILGWDIKEGEGLTPRYAYDSFWKAMWCIAKLKLKNYNIQLRWFRNYDNK